MSCSVCDEYDIFSYMEVGFCSLMIVLVLCLIVTELFYMKKVNKLEKDMDRLKNVFGLKND